MPELVPQPPAGPPPPQVVPALQNQLLSPLDLFWAAPDRDDSVTRLKAQYPGRRMRSPSHWKWDKNTKKLLPSSVWGQSSAGCRARRRDRRAHLQPDYHKGQVEAEAQSRCWEEDERARWEQARAWARYDRAYARWEEEWARYTREEG